MLLKYSINLGFSTPLNLIFECVSWVYVKENEKLSTSFDNFLIKYIFEKERTTLRDTEFWINFRAEIDRNNCVFYEIYDKYYYLLCI